MVPSPRPSKLDALKRYDKNDLMALIVKGVPRWGKSRSPAGRTRGEAGAVVCPLRQEDDSLHLEEAGHEPNGDMPEESPSPSSLNVLTPSSGLGDHSLALTPHLKFVG